MQFHETGLRIHDSSDRLVFQIRVSLFIVDECDLRWRTRKFQDADEDIIDSLSIIFSPTMRSERAVNHKRTERKTSELDPEASRDGLSGSSYAGSTPMLCEVSKQFL